MVDKKLLLVLPYELGDEDDLKEAGLDTRLIRKAQGNEDTKSILGGDLGRLLQNMMERPGEIDGEKMSVEQPSAALDDAFMDAVSETLTSGATFNSAEDIRKYLSTVVRNKRYRLLAAMDRGRRKRRIGLGQVPVNEEGEEAFEFADERRLTPEEEAAEKYGDEMENRLQEAEYAAEHARRRARSAPLRKRGRQAARES